MTRYVATKVLARQVIAKASSLATAALIFAITPAMAGDRASLDIIGYSQDGYYFAFEEFGIQDGSGFPYSNIYVVNLVNDSWLPGTPVRVQADSEFEDLQSIRAEAAEKVQPTIASLHVNVPADVIALIGDGTPDNTAKSLRFGVPSYNAGEVIGDYELKISTFPAKAASPCAEWFSVDPLGVKLTITENGKTRTLQEDADLPRSRGCPTAYRLHSVVLPFEAQDITQGVALISVYPGGFEGPDRRFIAVPIGQ
jgi:predicted secreted protein